jgi:ParB-like chromosome segregation protein Spo0J
MSDIKVIPIEDIKLYSRNAKKHPKTQIKQIASSIKNFSFLQPIVLDPNTLEIIVGHGRFLAAQVLGYQQVKIGVPFARRGEEFIPAISADDLSKEEIKAYRLADNKLNESGWDMPMVVEELKELKFADFDLTLTGFDNDDLQMFTPVGIGEQGKLDEKKLTTCPACGHQF